VQLFVSKNTSFPSNVIYHYVEHTSELATSVKKQFLAEGICFPTPYLILGDGNWWRQAEAWNLLLVGAVDVNALVLRQFTQ